MQRLFAAIRRIAPTRASVLIQGESGTGKERVAEALHAGGLQRGPFVTVDCGAMPPSLVASEVFGHERGAFTGADRQHAGAFERAHGGTLFLDEIAELPKAEQATLLGVLERRRFRRIGGREEIAVDVRVVAATHRDLKREAELGHFRSDLYFRLAVVTLRVPALRERREDLPLLVEHFVRELGHARPLDELVSPPVMARFGRYDWPGNVRELRNAVEATLLGETVALGEGPAAAAAGSVIGAVTDLPYKQARQAVMNEFEACYLARLLERAERNVSQAARLAQMDRSYLLELLQRHALARRTPTGSSSC